MASHLPWRRRRQVTDTVRERRGPALPACLSDECEAYLAGQYAQYAAERGWAIPTWAWINALAHGDEARLRSVEGEGLPGIDDPGWQSGIRRLARATLAEARRRWGLPYVQAAVLRPLESVLIDDRRYEDLSVHDFTALVIALIHGHPSARL